MLPQNPMESGATIKAVIALIEVDGMSQWFAGNMGADCRTLLIGADAYGVAGTHDRLEASRLESAPDAESALQSIGVAAAPVRDPALPEGARMMSYALSTQVAVLPPHCEYINGRWYCW